MLQNSRLKPSDKPLKRSGRLARKSKKKAAADRMQHAAYAAADDAEQEWCSVCGRAGPVEHSHLYSQHQHEKHRNDPKNWLQSCRACHDLFEHNKPLFAAKFKKAWALIIERMRAIDLKAYDFYAATNPLLYPDD